MVEQNNGEAPKDSLSPAVLPATRACPQCKLRLELSVDQCPQCGTDLIKPIQEDASFKHKYEFISTVGSGGMGIIYKARQIVLNKLVAIKMLHSHMAGADAFRRFQIEGKAASLLHHKYIVDVHDFGSTESGRPYMVMDYVEGLTLAQELADHGPLKQDRFLRIFLQVCDALSHAHNKGVLHRDIKPSNIMLVSTGGGADEVRIMDFGIAKLLSEQDGDSPQLTKTGEALGSPLYMSPEQSRSSQVDKRSDLYSLGCVMYEALTGAPPFIGKSSLETIMKHQETEPLPLSQASLGTTFDAGLEDIISRLLKKDPAARYQSIEELEADLIKFQDATIGGKQIRFKCEPEPPQRYEKRERVLVWIICTIVVALIAGIGAFCMTYKPIKPIDATPASTKTSSEEISDKRFTNPFEKDVGHPKATIADMVMQRMPRMDLSKAVRRSGATIQDADLAPLAGAANANEIILSDSAITDRGLEYIRGLQLKDLSLQNTNVRSLSAIKKMSTLEVLDVAGTLADSSGIVSISQLKNLKELSLARTGISDRDLPLLRKLTHLEFLSLSDCSHITETAVNRLRQEMKSCKIVTQKDADIKQAGGHLLVSAKIAIARRDWVDAENFLHALILQEQQSAGLLNYEGLARWQEMYGNCEVQLGNYDSAITSYDQAASNISHRADLKDMLARLYSERAEAYERNNDDSLARTKPENAIANAIKEREQASKIYASIQQPDSNSLDNLNMLARDHCMLHQDAPAIVIIKSGLPQYAKLKTQQSGEYAKSLHILANAEARTNQLDDAIKVYQECLSIYSSDPKWIDLAQSVRCNLASAYILQHKYYEAQTMLEQGLNAPCNSDKVRKDQYDVMAQCLQLQKKNDQAKHYQVLSEELNTKLNSAR
jgi:serine/threonine protein kinase/tetratricopeptide (TPR) repeat protein